MRILITGVTGFVGVYVATAALRQHPTAEIFGMALDPSANGGENPVPPEVRFIQGDVTDVESLKSTVSEARPDVIIHLAAASSGAASWSRPTEYFEINAMGTLRLLEATRDLGLDPIVIIASSGEIYGSASDENHPTTETAPYRPMSPYATSKAAQDLIAAQFGEAYGSRVIRLRLFNHTGPRRPAHFVASSFARQIVDIERGVQQPIIEVGNLAARRDFIDVRDAAQAYLLAAEHCEPGSAYNVCSGEAVSISDILHILISHSHIEVEIVQDPDRMRPADIPLLLGDPSRFQAATGWRPEIPLRQTLLDLLNWWRHSV